MLGGDDDEEDWLQRSGFFYIFHKQKCSCITHPPFVGMNLQNERSESEFDSALELGEVNQAILVRKSRPKKKGELQVCLEMIP